VIRELAQEKKIRDRAEQELARAVEQFKSRFVKILEGAAS
jgi:hypothetical protein